MSKNYALKANVRDRAGKGIARELRRNKQTPAVIYGDKKEPIKIALDENEINVEYNRGHMYTTLCDLEVGSDKHLVLVRDVQLHPVSDNVIHVDFLRVTPKTKIVVSVPVQFINENDSPGMREKGVLNVARYEVELLCSAMAIPDQVEVDLTGKEHGDTIRMSDAALPEGTSPVIDDRDFTIAALMAPKTMAEIEAEEAAEAASDEAAAADADGAEGEETGKTAEGGDAEGGDAPAEGGEEKSGEEKSE